MKMSHIKCQAMLHYNTTSPHNHFPRSKGACLDDARISDAGLCNEAVDCDTRVGAGCAPALQRLANRRVYCMLYWSSLPHPASHALTMACTQG